MENLKRYAVRGGLVSPTSPTKTAFPSSSRHAWINNLTVAPRFGRKLRILMSYLGELFDHPESDHLSVAEGGFDFDDGVD